MSNSKRCNMLRQFRNERSDSLNSVSAVQFYEIWNHYDKDGNGSIEGAELDNFLRELAECYASDGTDKDLNESIVLELKEAFLEAYDDDSNGKITLDELAEILPTDQNFLLLFRHKNQSVSTIEFVKLWKQFDTNASGFIEADELKEFVRYLFAISSKDIISEDKISDYADSILKIFDKNKDGKLQFSEMSKLMPHTENFSQKPILKLFNQIPEKDIDGIFSQYIDGGDDIIIGTELDELIKHLKALVKSDMKLEDFKKALLNACDMNDLNKASVRVLKMILTNVSNI